VRPPRVLEQPRRNDLEVGLPPLSVVTAAVYRNRRSLRVTAALCCNSRSLS